MWGRAPVCIFYHSLALADSLRSWGLDATKLSGRGDTQPFPRGVGEGLGTMPLPVCSPVTHWLRQEGGSLVAGGGVDGSSPNLLPAQRVAGFHCEEGGHNPACWPFWGLSSWPGALMLGSDQTAGRCSQELGWRFLGLLGASGGGASRACLRMSSA